MSVLTDSHKFTDQNGNTFIFMVSEDPLHETRGILIDLLPSSDNQEIGEAHASVLLPFEVVKEFAKFVTKVNKEMNPDEY